MYMEKKYENVYKSWLEKTKDIEEDCKLCDNQRYTITLNADTTFQISSCPSCNWSDLQRNKKINYLIPLHTFVEKKKHEKEA